MKKLTLKALLAVVFFTSTSAMAGVGDDDVIGLKNGEPVEYAPWAEDLRQIITTDYERQGGFNVDYIHSEVKYVSCPALQRFKAEVNQMYWVKYNKDDFEDLMSILKEHDKSCKKNDF